MEHTKLHVEIIIAVMCFIDSYAFRVGKVLGNLGSLEILQFSLHIALLNTIVGDIPWATYQIKIYPELTSFQPGLKWLYLNYWTINSVFEWHAIEPFYTNAIF